MDIFDGQIRVGVNVKTICVIYVLIFVAFAIIKF